MSVMQLFLEVEVKFRRAAFSRSAQDRERKTLCVVK